MGEIIMLIITLTNDSTSPSPATGNYDYEVFVNTKKIAKGRVDHHFKTRGWQGLVKDLAMSVDRAEETPRITEEAMRKLIKLIKES